MSDNISFQRNDGDKNDGRFNAKREVEPTIYRSFRCPRCKTEISVAKNEVGTTVVCPDCDTSLVVPDYLDFTETDEERRRAARASGETARRAELVSPVKNPTREGIDFAKENVYSVDNGKNADAKKKYARENMFPVRCGVCHTLMYATRDELGKPIRCPDCGTETVATDSLRKRFDFEANQNRMTAPTPTSAEYNAEEPEPVLTNLTYRRFLRKISRRKKTGKVERPDDFLPLELRRRGDRFIWVLASPPKKFPMLNGVFRALATGELWARGGLVALLAAGVASLLSTTILPAIKVYRENPFPNNPLWELEVLAVCAIFVPLLCVFWSITSTYFTSIFTTGNSGARRAVEWRDEDPIGYLAFGGWFFLIVAAALAPGMLAAAFLDGGLGGEATEIEPGASWLAAALKAGSIWLLFPIFWLSTLLDDSFFSPFSRTLAGTFWSRGRAWLQFYLGSALLFGVPATFFFRFIGESGGVWFFFPIGVVLAQIFYALFLGRLSWILDDKIRRDAEDAEAENGEF